MKLSRTSKKDSEATPPTIQKTDDEWRRGADAGSVRSAPQGGHRKGLHRRVLGLPRRRHLSVRGVSGPAVQLRHQVRIGQWMAQLF